MLEPDVKSSEIVSEAVVFPSRSGGKIVGFIDRLRDLPADAPFVVVSPKYGQSKKNTIPLAYLFACNGFQVLRFDHTNHFGESDGGIVDYTLPGAVDDILAAIDYLEIQHGADEIVLQSNSMSARCALRAARLDDRVARLVCLVGVVNFRATITEICRKDIVSAYMDGAIQGVGDILGHQVNIDQFLKTCVDSDMHDLGGSLIDMQGARCEVFMFAAENDAWVDYGELESIVARSPRVHLRSIAGAMHELMENPKVAANIMLQAVFASLYGRFPEADEKLELQTADRAAVMRQNKVERERLRAIAPVRESEGDFWRQYLDKYRMLESVGAYREYLDLIGACLGAPEPGQAYFDCGCGNGMFGTWCLRDLLQRNGRDAEPPIAYFGLDLTGRGLAEALQRHGAHVADFGDDGLSPLDLFYLRFDLDEVGGKRGALKLPFADESFDRICCSLLVSYLANPSYLLEELRRVLKKDGRIIVSSMKPYCDLSVIYKGHISEATDEASIQRGRDLLSAAGSIQIKEEEGVYTFYGEEELRDLVAGAGFAHCQVFRTFGDQANLVAAAK